MSDSRTRGLSCDAAQSSTRTRSHESASGAVSPAMPSRMIRSIASRTVSSRRAKRASSAWTPSSHEAAMMSSLPAK